MAVSQVERPIVDSVTELQYISTCRSYLYPRRPSRVPSLHLPPLPNFAILYCQYPWYQGLARRLEVRRSLNEHTRPWLHPNCFAARLERAVPAFSFCKMVLKSKSVYEVSMLLTVLCVSCNTDPIYIYMQKINLGVGTGSIIRPENQRPSGHWTQRPWRRCTFRGYFLRWLDTENVPRGLQSGLWRRPLTPSCVPANVGRGVLCQENPCGPSRLRA